MNRLLTALPFSRIAPLLPLLIWSFLCTVQPASAANWNGARPAYPSGQRRSRAFSDQTTAEDAIAKRKLARARNLLQLRCLTKIWFALAGVSLETAPGTYALELTGETRAGKDSATKISFSHKFAVARGKYPKIAVKLSVEGKFTEPTPNSRNKCRKVRNQERLLEPGHARARVVRAIHRAG